MIRAASGEASMFEFARQGRPFLMNVQSMAVTRRRVSHYRKAMREGGYEKKGSPALSRSAGSGGMSSSPKPIPKPSASGYRRSRRWSSCGRHSAAAFFARPACGSRYPRVTCRPPAPVSRTASSMGHRRGSPRRWRKSQARHRRRHSDLPPRTDAAPNSSQQPPAIHGAGRAEDWPLPRRADARLICYVGRQADRVTNINRCQSRARRRSSAENTARTDLLLAHHDFEDENYVHQPCRYLGRGGDLRVLSDPWWQGPCFGNQWWLYPKPYLECLDGRPIDYVYISHGHPDHFHRGTLRRFPRGTKVIISRGSALARALQDMDLEVIQLAPEEVRILATVSHARSCRITAGIA